jgi:hypothetical protein
MADDLPPEGMTRQEINAGLNEPGPRGGPLPFFSFFSSKFVSWPPLG